MAQQVLVTKPEDLNLISGTYIVEGELTPAKWSSDPHRWTMPCTHAHMHTHTQSK